MASVLLCTGFWATVWLLRSFPHHFLCFRCLACVLIGCYCLSFFGFGLVFVLRRLLRDSVESLFLRDGVLPLGQVCSVGCGFSVCAVFTVFLRLPLFLFLGWLLHLWLQALLGLLMAVPGFLPSRMALLCLQRSHPFLWQLPVIRLSGFSLSSDASAPSVSLLQCLDTLPASGSPPSVRSRPWRTLHGLSVAHHSVLRVSSFLLSLIRSLRSSLGFFLACCLSLGSSLAP